MKRIIATAILGCTLAATAHASSARPVVLELFTSQGCSSCPSADALLAELARDPGVLPLSFHVDYWDQLGWRDVFSSQDNTRRQHQYSQWMSRNNVFTPQLVVDGTMSVNGSDRSAVAQAVGDAKPLATQSHVMGRRNEMGDAIFSVGPATANSAARLIAVRYLPSASTVVERGENSGRVLPSVNNVLAISDLGAWQTEARDYTVSSKAGEGVALLLQEAGGKIMGAAALGTQ